MPSADSPAITISRRALLASGGAVAGIAAFGGSAAASTPAAPTADLASAAPGANPADGLVAVSPNGRTRVSVWADSTGLWWSVKYAGREVLAPSPLGLITASGSTLGASAEVTGRAVDRQSSTWQPLYGRNSTITDAYGQVRLDLTDSGVPFSVVARAYDEGAAIRYALTGSGTVMLAGEATGFALPEATLVYTARDEDPWVLSEPAQIPSSGSTATDSGQLTDAPIPVSLGNGMSACICEAARQGYPRMMLAAAAHGQALRVHLMQFAGRGGTTTTPVTSFGVTAPFETPWRVVIIGETSAELINHSDLVVNLAPPSALGDTSWIRPGKAIRVSTLTTAIALACVDFAVARNLQYIEFDAGWYGPETSASSNPVQPIAALDMPQILSYASSKNIGVILYLNQIALATYDIAAVFGTYRQWGIAGIKMGFIWDGTQAQTDWLISTVTTAADYRLLVDAHDDLRPFGQERTYPNFILMEGVRGNEHFPTATHNVTLPFGRNVGGPMDYTICYAQSRDKTTNAHQLAMAAVYYMPLGWFYWYDVPSKYADTTSWPELSWFDSVPTVWDESRALAGEIGQYVVIARRSGSTWFLGAMTSEQSRVVEVPLSFLGTGQWQATIYADGTPGDNPYQTPVKISTQTVTAGTTLTIRMAYAGGQAIRFTPA